MPGGLFSTAKLFGVTIRESANDGSDFTNPDADYRRLFLGEDGQLHTKDSAGTVAGIGSGTPAFVGAKAYAAGTQSISDATTTIVLFDTEDYDTSAFHSTVTNTGRFVVPTTGYYSLVGGLTLAFTTSAVIAQAWFRLDGTTNLRAGITWLPNATPPGVIVSTVVQLTAAQYVELMIYQDSTGSRNIGSAAPETQSFAAVTLLGT